MKSSNQIASSNRHRLLAPSVALATIGLIVYVMIFYGMAQASGISYGEWFATAKNALHSALIPLLAGSGFLALFILVFRWNALWRDPVQLPTTRLQILLMLMFTSIILVRLLFIRWHDVPIELLLVVLGVGVGVGLPKKWLCAGFFCAVCVPMAGAKAVPCSGPVSPSVYCISPIFF